MQAVQHERPKQSFDVCIYGDWCGGGQSVGWGVNEILNQRIQAVQIGKDITYAQLIAKRNLREELETEMEKYLARGGQIKQVEQKQYEAKHGTNTQYTNMGCRCKKCHAWALKAKKVKTGEIRL